MLVPNNLLLRGNCFTFASVKRAIGYNDRTNTTDAIKLIVIRFEVLDDTQR